MKAEFTAASVMATEVLGVRERFGELVAKIVESIPLLVNNQVVLEQLDGETASAEAKHIDVRIKFVDSYTRRGTDV